MNCLTKRLLLAVLFYTMYLNYQTFSFLLEIYVFCNKDEWMKNESNTDARTRGSDLCPATLTDTILTRVKQVAVLD